MLFKPTTKKEKKKKNRRKKKKKKMKKKKDEEENSVTRCQRRPRLYQGLLAQQQSMSCTRDPRPCYCPPTIPRASHSKSDRTSVRSSPKMQIHIDPKEIGTGRFWMGVETSDVSPFHCAQSNQTNLLGNNHHF